MPAYHRRAVGIQFRWIDYSNDRSSRIFQMPAIPRHRGQSFLGVLASRSMTGATCDAQFGNLRVPRLVSPIQVRLGLDVVTKNAVRIPFGDVLPVITSVGVKERPVEMHPAALHNIVSDRQADPLVTVFGQILLNPPRTNSAPNFKLLLLPIRADEFHPVTSVFTNHFGANALIG